MIEMKYIVLSTDEYEGISSPLGIYNTHDEASIVMGKLNDSENNNDYHYDVYPCPMEPYEIDGVKMR